MEKQFLISKEEKNRILGLHESYTTNHGTSLLNETDTADKMMECQEKNVGNFTPEDEKQFGILFQGLFQYRKNTCFIWRPGTSCNKYKPVFCGWR